MTRPRGSSLLGPRAKSDPADVGAVWDPADVDRLGALDRPVFFDFAGGRAAQEARFGGESFPDVVEASGSGLVFAEFFRIAKGRTQRRLAEELGVAEQQVQRYESTGYASASLARLGDVAAALGAEARETVSWRGPDAA